MPRNPNDQYDTHEEKAMDMEFQSDYIDLQSHFDGKIDSFGFLWNQRLNAFIRILDQSGWPMRDLLAPLEGC